MQNTWCKECNRIIKDSDKCTICGGVLQADVPTEVHWCVDCKVPLIVSVNEKEKKCTLCSKETKYLCKDLRPVFPEERLLIEVLLNIPFEWQGKSVWANNSRYYVDGKAFNVSLQRYRNADINKAIEGIATHSQNNSCKSFEEYKGKFIEANQDRLRLVTTEAMDFVVKEAAEYRPEQRIISFSGGKDSTAVADVVIKALRDPSIRHVFGDTTLEMPHTYEYKDRYRKDNPKAIFKTAKNREQDFYKVCEDIGPPARMMRWCCTMFKTGPITRTLNAAFRKEKVLTFYGIRKNESAARSKYNRIDDESNKVKIQKQAVASPIFFWSDLEIWLYILGEQVDFNDAYRLGFDRVGCWNCPNNTLRAQFLAKIYMPEESKKWRDYLISFAKSVGKPDPEEYVDGGWWKARQGGNGVAASEDIILRQTNCTTEENAKIYNLNKPLSDAFYNLLNPFGKVSKELGRKMINEVIVLDLSSNIPIISVMPFEQQGYDYPVKIKTMNAKHADLHRMIGYQVKKHNACRLCLKCESICNDNAITMTGTTYTIDDKKCTRCKKCVSAQYLDGGCLMNKFLRTVKGKP